jgi:hypothetical protein
VGIDSWAGWDDVPVWLQPLTRWPLMQDWQAYFSPSMIGMPLGNYGRLRSSHQAVDSRAEWSRTREGRQTAPATYSKLRQAVLEGNRMKRRKKNSNAESRRGISQW